MLNKLILCLLTLSLSYSTLATPSDLGGAAIDPASLSVVQEIEADAAAAGGASAVTECDSIEEVMGGEVLAQGGCCRICRTGKACGNSCISRNYTCHQPRGCACNG